MTRDKPFDDTLDEALLGDESGRDESGRNAIEVVAQGLRALTPPEGLLQRVLASAGSEPRFARYAAVVARLLDITVEQANELLARLGESSSWEAGFLPGMELCHVKGGPRVANAITGFVRIRENVIFPEHEHFGEESVLILQGRCEDDGKILGPGDELAMGPNTHHSFAVCPGPDLLYLAVVQKGLRIGDTTLFADDPRV